MKAITLHRPWDQAILHGGKTHENRCWCLPAKYLGRPICLHAGLQYDVDAAISFELSQLYLPPFEERSPVGVVGVVIFDRVETASDSPWFCGPYGWRVAIARPLATALTCRGYQGLWTVPDVVAREIAAQIDLASRNLSYVNSSRPQTA